MLSSYWEQLKLIVQPKTKMYEEVGGFIAIGSIFPRTGTGGISGSSAPSCRSSWP